MRVVYSGSTPPVRKVVRPPPLGREVGPDEVWVEIRDLD
jgi:hypothetical protein